jgi:beta-N-acetylhexosaminidase
MPVKIKIIIILSIIALFIFSGRAIAQNPAAGPCSPEFEVAKRKLIKSSLTVLNNMEVLPLRELGNNKIASVMTGVDSITPFQKMLGRYTGADHFFLGKYASERDLANLRMVLDNYDLVIIGIGGINDCSANNYVIDEININAVFDIITDHKTIAVFFGDAHALKHFKNIHHASGLIVAWHNDRLTQELAAQLIFGAFDARGKLPMNVDDRFKLNGGILLNKNQTLSFTIPEETGVNSSELSRKIDSLAQLGIDSFAYPGCQVLIAKDGNVIFHKCYGFHTYENEREVRYDDIYDWASLTKVTGPLPAIMKLVDEGKIDIDDPLSRYWPGFAGTDKERIKIREILAHQSGLPAWIPFWRMALDKKGRLSRNIFKNQPSVQFNIRVSNHWFLNNRFREMIFDTIRTSKLLPYRRYVYSGLAFYLFPDIISSITGEPYEKYIKNTFYLPLGAESVTYNAYKYFPLYRIIPTENDDFFRNEKLCGFVHDEGAAMMGGVSGNAGLFGNITDLAKIFQMYLQKGYYGGKRYISAETVNEFIRIQYPENNNRRGLGFDKPYIDNKKRKLEDAYPAVDAGESSFGHTGYTGTFVWADPENGLLFIFMSNRVHPKRENNKLTELNIRTAMHQSVYDCIKK